MYEQDELTIVSEESGPGASGPYTCFTLGPFDLNLVGVLAKVTEVLAEASIPVFVISTYRYDHVLVPSSKWQEAEAAMTSAGLNRKA